jgi:hypothetical protein
MTFLFWFFRKMLGPPPYGDSWRCPKCDPNSDYCMSRRSSSKTDPTRGGKPGRKKAWACLSVRPPKSNLAIKFRCHRCSWWGDEFDLLKLLRPSLSYDARLMVMQRFYEEYMAECPTTPRMGEGSKPSPKPKAAKTDGSPKRGLGRRARCRSGG